MSSWIEHVKQYSKDNNVSYKQALTQAKSTYKKVNGGSLTKPKKQYKHKILNKKSNVICFNTERPINYEKKNPVILENIDTIKAKFDLINNKIKNISDGYITNELKNNLNNALTNLSIITDALDADSKIKINSTKKSLAKIKQDGIIKRNKNNMFLQNFSKMKN